MGSVYGITPTFILDRYILFEFSFNNLKLYKHDEREELLFFGSPLNMYARNLLAHSVLNSEKKCNHYSFFLGISHLFLNAKWHSYYRNFLCLAHYSWKAQFFINRMSAFDKCILVMYLFFSKTTSTYMFQKIMNLYLRRRRGCQWLGRRWNWAWHRMVWICFGVI